ncbi:MAG: TatD family hydrolase [Prolixibacteraceae bacterium]|nr:TatD family hydrolase [Prolixibacteraceae bacterium]MBN2774745.1 TatD family hydrolase [Prolixibacteraceae bacterium]
MLYIDIHTHKDHFDPEIISVRNIYPGDGFGAYNGRNYYSTGLHPWHIKSTSENDESLATIKKSVQFDHVVFIGECGLDKLCETNFEEQKRVFIKQIELSEEFNKPVLIHCVKATDDILEIKKELKPDNPWILHGFNGNLNQALQLIKYGFLFSFGKILFNKSSKAIESFQKLPLDSVFIETDEFSGSVRDIYKKASEIRDIDISLLARSMEINFNKLVR